jgi:DNA-binding ferritin-like protein (Dps family)
MPIDFQAALDEIGGEAGVLEIANEARTPGNYLLATILPQRNLPGWEASAGSMTIRTIMAGLVGMDSKYPEGASRSMSTFREQLAKIAHQDNLPEATLRELMGFVERAIVEGRNSRDVVLNTVLNFLNKLLLQSSYDTEEWMRGQALFTGALEWTFNGITLDVDYGIPSANLFATRTGTSAYGGSASVFWADLKAARRILKNNVRALIGSTNTVDAIVYNEANTLEVLNQDNGSFTLRRLVGTGSNLRPSTNQTETVSLIAYDGQGEAIDPATGSTVHVDFIPEGTLGVFARNEPGREFRIDEGSTPDPETDVELGWTQIGPTIEAQGRIGRYANIYTPEAMPMQLRGQVAANVMPVIRNPEKIVIMSTEV